MAKKPKSKYKLNLTNNCQIAKCEIELTRLKNSGADNNQMNDYVKKHMIKKSEIKVGDIVRVKALKGKNTADRWMYVKGFAAIWRDNAMVFCVNGIVCTRRAIDLFIVCKNKISVPYNRCIKFHSDVECSIAFIEDDFSLGGITNLALEYKKFKGLLNDCSQNTENDDTGFFDRNFEKDFN